MRHGARDDLFACEQRSEQGQVRSARIVRRIELFGLLTLSSVLLKRWRAGRQGLQTSKQGTAQGWPCRSPARSPSTTRTGRCWSWGCLDGARHGHVRVDWLGTIALARRSWGMGAAAGWSGLPAENPIRVGARRGSGAHQANMAYRGGWPPSGHVLDEFGVSGLGAGVVTGQRRGDLLEHPDAGMPVRDLPDPALRGDAQAGGLHQPPAMQQRVDRGLVRGELAAPAAANAPAARGGADHGPTAHLATSLTVTVPLQGHCLPWVA
jgi:hypothetical protein